MLHELEKSNPIVLDTGLHKVRELLNEEGARHFGKNRGWCTTEPDNTWYLKSYSHEHGRLFLIYKGKKKRPEAQMFISGDKSVEIRKKFNKHVAWDMNFGHPDPELNDWRDKVILSMDIKDYPKAVTRVDPWFAPAGFQRGRIPVFPGVYDNHDPYTRVTLEMKIYEPPERIHRADELGPAHGLDPRRVYMIEETSEIVICGTNNQWMKYRFVEFQIRQDMADMAYRGMQMRHPIPGFTLTCQLILEHNDQLNALMESGIINQAHIEATMEVHRPIERIEGTINLVNNND